MVDISKINLPDGNTYDIKDASATDTKVTQTNYTNNLENFRLLLSHSANNTTETAGVYKHSDFYVYRSYAGRNILKAPYIVCDDLSATNFSGRFPSYTLSKTSGNWSLKEIVAYRCGSIVQMNVLLKGNGSAVGTGTDGFVGKFTAGAMPTMLTRFVAFASASTILGYYDPSDSSFRMRNLGSSITLSSSSTLTCGATFILP